MGCRASKNIRSLPITHGERTDPEGSYYSAYASETKQFWTCDKTSCVETRFSAQGAGSQSGTQPMTLPQLVARAVANQGDKPLLRVEVGDNMKVLPRGATPPDCLALDAWKSWTYQQYYDECLLVGQGFMSLGLERFDAVTIYGFNSPEWIMAEMGCILAGGIAAGIYPTDTAEQVKFKALHSGSVVACVQNLEKMEKFLQVAADLPKLKAIVVWAPEQPLASEDRAIGGGRNIRCMSWEALKTIGEQYSDGYEPTINSRIDSQQPGHCCAYIYTSGTTGQPKAVMISHDNIVFEAFNAASLIKGFAQDPNEGDRIISYLPLSHVAGMMVDIVCPIVGAAVMKSWVTVHFARPYDLKAGTIGDRLRGVRPTVFLGVPRVWEKIQEKMMATVAKNPPTGMKLKIIRWAKGLGLEHQNNCQLGGSGDFGWGYGFAESKVLNTVKLRLGLDACKFCFTGAAPIKTETLQFFGALGLQINEVYGMSECTGATTWSTDDAHVWGSCGWAMPSAEVSIRKPISDGASSEECKVGEDGEVCYRGRHIMMGYMANPDLGEDHVETIKGKNRGAIDGDGWLRSGDKGRMDQRGMVKITGRYKELIIGAGGENVAPVPVEDGVKSRCPAISNIMMVGDKRKYNVALVTLKAVGATGELPGTDELEAVSAEAAGVSTISAAMDSQQMIDAITAAIQATNSDQSCCPMPPSKIQKFMILPTDFSVQTGELTPTLKLKRSVVTDKYAAAIDTMYTEEVKRQNYIRFPSSESKN